MSENQHLTKAEKRFRWFGQATILLLFLVILAGAIVRATGSGMGCPDWPRCFGLMIPPTDVSQLPHDYAEKYAVHGYVAEFNVYKTWTEYGNRLVSVILGFFAIGAFITSLPFFKTKPRYVYLTFVTLLLIGFEAWLGKVVVSTNLSVSVITVHMLCALIITFLALYTHFWDRLSVVSSEKINSKYAFFSAGLLLALFVQVGLGTRVREMIDQIAASNPNLSRNLWIDEVGNLFLIHRSFSILLVLFYLFLSKKLMELSPKNTLLRRLILAVGGAISVEVLSGVVLRYFGFPALAQPLHLLFGSAIVSLQFLLTMLIFKQSNSQNLNKKLATQ